jgi:hypothetical protein
MASAGVPTQMSVADVADPTDGVENRRQVEAVWSRLRARGDLIVAKERGDPARDQLSGRIGWRVIVEARKVRHIGDLGCTPWKHRLAEGPDAGQRLGWLPIQIVPRELRPARVDPRRRLRRRERRRHHERIHRRQ